MYNTKELIITLFHCFKSVIYKDGTKTEVLVPSLKFKLYFELTSDSECTSNGIDSE
jgi:hypothetical protein